MPKERLSREKKLAPIFVFAESDREASQRIFEHLHDEWCYIPVSNPQLVVQYTKQFATTAVFLSSSISYPGGGAAALLQQLLDQVGKPVVILLEDWNSDEADRWKRMGAVACLPHPTRFDLRLKLLRSKMQDLAFATMPRPGSVLDRPEEHP